MVEPKLSFIIPVYNAEKYIKRCIDSIIGQEYWNIEIIVVDDGSEDSSNKIVRQCADADKRIKIYTIKNGGVSNARNAGLEKATGDYILFADADDYYENGFISNLIGYVISDNLSILNFSFNIDYRLIKKRYIYQVKTGYIFTEQEMLCEEFWEKFIKTGDYLNVWHMIIAAPIAQSIRFEHGLSFGEDTLYTIQCLSKSARTLFVDVVGYNYCINRNGTIQNVNEEKLKKKINDIISSYELIGEVLIERGVHIPVKVIGERCAEMISGDVNKLLLSTKSYKQNINLREMVFQEVENKSLFTAKCVEEKMITDKWMTYCLKKCFFKIKTLIKSILFSY